LLSNHKKKQILFLSNGHGEDVNNCQILQALIDLVSDQVELAAMPIVGNGETYRHLNVPIIGPVSSMPSGGVFYMNPLFLLKDVAAGLISLTWQQLQAVKKHAANSDLIVAVGDIVVAAIAHFTGCTYVIFLSGYSSYYEEHLRLSPILWHFLQSKQCIKVFTRDAFTASDLNQQGLTKAECVGMPVMDCLKPKGKDLYLLSGVPVITLLPGSRLPEASNNFCLQLQLVRKIAQEMYPMPVQFIAALVPSLMLEIPALASAQNWQYQDNSFKFTETIPGGKNEFTVEVRCYGDAFADILQQSNLVIGMTGTAVEQAVGLGKPVIAIPGNGPAFTYRFAEAQMRLLGKASLQVIGTKPATPEILQLAAQKVKETLQDSNYLQGCVQNGIQRMGTAGASARIAHYLVNYLNG
jgi:uncharacterized protein (TIGR03492 family)